MSALTRENPDLMALLITCQKMRKRRQMIGLSPLLVSMTTKYKKTLRGSRDRSESIRHFYGRLRAFQGIRGLSRTGGYGRFRCQWVNKLYVRSLVE